MYQLNVAVAARNWTTSNGHRVPAAVNMACPICREPGTFSIGWVPAALRGTPSKITCPSCGKPSTLIALDVSDKATVRLYIDAAPPTREPVPGLDEVPEEILPARLRKAYQSALNVLAIGEAEATAVTCRRVLEGVTARLLTDEGAKTEPLAARIRALADETATLAKPLLELSDSLRTSGNLGAHFDPDGEEPSIEDASHMVDLLDYLLTYLYVLPQQVHQFRVAVLNEASDETEPDANTEDPS